MLAYYAEKKISWSDWYSVAPAVLFGAHEIFTRLVADHIGDGIGCLVVEGVAALTILGYLGVLRAILVGGAAAMAIAGVFFSERASWQRMLGGVGAISAFFLLRS